MLEPGLAVVALLGRELEVTRAKARDLAITRGLQDGGRPPIGEIDDGQTARLCIGNADLALRLSAFHQLGRDAFALGGDLWADLLSACFGVRVCRDRPGPGRLNPPTPHRKTP